MIQIVLHKNQQVKHRSAKIYGTLSGIKQSPLTVDIFKQRKNIFSISAKKN
tara:strand:+ start:700 stop:852 length:153 start_codon:yes stop_codon:yes gene_type:complete